MTRVKCLHLFEAMGIETGPSMREPRLQVPLDQRDETKNVLYRLIKKNWHTFLVSTISIGFQKGRYLWEAWVIV